MKRARFLETNCGNCGQLQRYLAAPVPVLGDDDKAGSKPTSVVGWGEHTYECNHDWCKLPEGWVWQTTHGVCVDGEGLVYIKQQGHQESQYCRYRCRFRAKRQVRSIIHSGKGIHPGGHGIDLQDGSEEFLYLCDTAHVDAQDDAQRGRRLEAQFFRRK